MQSAKFRVRLTPRSKVDRIEGWIDPQTLKVRVHAPPVDGKANEALIELLAEKLHCPKSAVTIQSGHGSRDKSIWIVGLTIVEVKKRVNGGAGKG